MKKLILILSNIFLLSACASVDKSMMLGAGVGAATGALIGNSQGNRGNWSGPTNTGLLVGAGLGLAIGYLNHQGENKKSSIKGKKRKSRKKRNLTPYLTRPKIKRVWVEDKIQGKRFIKGHWEFVIEENSEWSKK